MRFGTVWIEPDCFPQLFHRFGKFALAREDQAEVCARGGIPWREVECFAELGRRFLFLVFRDECEGELRMRFAGTGRNDQRTFEEAACFCSSALFESVMPVLMSAS